jgi:protoporphyrinogen oxidase
MVRDGGDPRVDSCMTRLFSLSFGIDAAELPPQTGLSHPIERARPDVLILGAGATGLGAGLGVALAGSGQKVVIIERNSRPGGLAGSFTWKNHSIDFGPHRLSPNLRTIRALAEELLGPDLLVQKSQHGVQFKGRLYQFPPRVRDFLHPAPIWYSAAFAASFAAAKLNWIVRRFDADTFESTIVRKFGRRFYRTIAAPMAEKVWIDPSQIDPMFANQRFAQVRPAAVIKKLIFPRQELNPASFYYPRRGYQQLWDAIAELVVREGNEIWCDARPTSIQVEGSRVVSITLKTREGETTVDTRNVTVLSTIPLTPLLAMIKGADFSAAREIIGRVKYRSMLLAMFEFDQSDTLPFRTLIFPESNLRFNRLFEQNKYSRETVAAGRSVVVADVTVPHGDPANSAPSEEILAEIEADLRKLNYVPVDRIVDRNLMRVEYAYAVPDIESRRATARVLHDLKRISNLHFLGRFSVGEYDNADYAIDNGLTFGAMLGGRISRLEYICSIQERRDRSIVG